MARPFSGVRVDGTSEPPYRSRQVYWAANEAHTLSLDLPGLPALLSLTAGGRYLLTDEFMPYDVVAGRRMVATERAAVVCCIACS
jgi:hypothetical protein